MILPSGLQYTLKRVGPKTDPCGTPYLTRLQQERELFTFTEVVRSTRYDRNHCKASDNLLLVLSRLERHQFIYKAKRSTVFICIRYNMVCLGSGRVFHCIRANVFRKVYLFSCTCWISIL